MEGIFSMLFIFILPLFGGVMLLDIFRKMSKFKRIRNLIVGLSLLSMPFIYFYIGNSNYKKSRQQLIGKYYLNKDTSTHLTLYNDSLFTLDSNRHFKNAGKGKWDMLQEDMYVLELTFSNNQVERFEISQMTDTIIIQYGMVGDQSNILFLKTTQKH
ncbi:MAG: hypothetical protein EAY66_09670 [Sphingobacteriales bacterium]|jgi:hypothetical protein|nr:MAG: hypothetical protein EAY66_09670 [Sphingobacteriales bacterium]